MRIYLMRHAKAVAASLWHGSDEDRPLSDVGFADLHAAIPHIEKSDMNVGTVFTSPFDRAHDTARLVKTAFEHSKIVVVKELAAGAKPADFRNVLLTSTEPQNFLFVGHNPDLSIFASKCTGIARFLDDFSLDTGEIVCLETGPLEKEWLRGNLLWRKDIYAWSK